MSNEKLCSCAQQKPAAVRTKLRTYTEKAFFCITEAGFELESPRTRKKRKAEKDLNKKERGRS
jgi:hypothetical protein